MRREGVKRMIVGGLLFFVVAPLVFVAAIGFGVGGAVNALSDSERLAPGESTYLEAGEEVSIFILTPDLSPTDGPTATLSTDTPTCTTSGPDGSDGDLRRSGGATVSDNGDDWREGYQLTAGPAGDYAITCGDRDTLVMDEDIATLVGRGMVFLVIALAVPFLVGVVGLGLFIWGLVRYNATKPPPPGGYQPPPGGYQPRPGGYQPPYPQGGGGYYPPQHG